MLPHAAAPHAPDYMGRRRGPDADSKPGASRWLLPLIVLLALALRVVAWSGAAQMAGEGPDYLWQAQRLQAGDVPAALSHPFPPLYAMTIAAVGKLTGDLALAGALVSMLAGALMVLAVHGLARLALPDRHDVACGAALLAAVYPPGLLVTSNVTGDGLFLALFLMAMLLLFNGEQSGKLRLRLFAVGLLLGLAWLAGAEGVFLLLPVAWWFVAGMVRRESRRHQPLPPRNVYASALGLCLLGLALFAVPHAIFVHQVSDGWGAALAGFGDVVAVETRPAPADSPLGSPSLGRVPRNELVATPQSWLPPEAERVALALGAERRADRVTRDAAIDRSREALPDGTDAIAGATGDATVDSIGDAEPVPTRPTRPIKRLSQQVQLVGVSFVEAADALGRTLRIDMLVLAALGLGVVVRRRIVLLSMLVLLLAGWLALATAQLMLRGELGSHDLLGPALLVLPLAGAGVALLWGAARYYPDRGTPLRIAGRVPVVLLVVALIGLTVSGALAAPAGAAARVEALAWAREHSGPEERIAVIERGDAWYAQRPILAVGLPADEAEVVAEMKRLDVRLLVQRLDDVQRHAPEWLAGVQFTELIRFGEGPDAVVVLERMPG